MADNKLYKVAITLDGKYVHGKEYDKLVQVFYDEADGGDGCSYVSRKRNVNVRPGTDDTVWQKSSERGRQGEQGQTGSTGQNGLDGAAAGFGTPTASVSGGVGTPSVQITSSGPDTAKVFNFAFSNLKGETGATGDTGQTGPQGPAGVTSAVVTSDGTSSSSPTATASVNDGVLSIAFTGLKGAKGDSGYSGASGELQVVNDDTSGGEDAAWSAERGKQIRTDLTQLRGDVFGTKNTITGWTSGKNIYTNQGVGETCPKTMNSSSGWQCKIVSVQNSAVYIVNGQGGSSPRLWCFLDEDDKILSVCSADKTYANDSLVLTPPTGATQLIINSKNTDPCYEYFSGEHDRIYEEFDDVHDEIDESKEAFLNYVGKSYLVGDGQNFVFRNIYGFVPGRKYRITLVNNSWDMTGITESGIYRFSIVSYHGETATNLALVYVSYYVMPVYEIVVPDDSDYIRFGGRAASGAKIEFNIQDITEQNVHLWRTLTEDDALYHFQASSSRYVFVYAIDDKIRFNAYLDSTDYKMLVGTYSSLDNALLNDSTGRRYEGNGYNSSNSSSSTSWYYKFGISTISNGYLAFHVYKSGGGDLSASDIVAIESGTHIEIKPQSGVIDANETDKKARLAYGLDETEKDLIPYISNSFGSVAANAERIKFFDFDFIGKKKVSIDISGAIEHVPLLQYSAGIYGTILGAQCNTTADMIITLFPAWQSESAQDIIVSPSGVFDLYFRKSDSSYFTTQDYENIRDNIKVTISNVKEEVAVAESANVGVFPIGNFVRASGTGETLSDSTTVVSGSEVCVPHIGVKYMVSVPSALKVRFVYGASVSLGSTTPWMVDGDEFTMPNTAMVNRIQFTKVNGSALTLDEMSTYINNGDIRITYPETDLPIHERNYESETFVKAALFKVVFADSADIYAHQGFNSMATIVHVSDLHGDVTRFDNAYKIADRLGVDVIVSTGDNVVYSSKDGTLYMKDVNDNGVTPFLTCIGNHEVSPQNTVTESYLFSNHISPFISKNGYLKEVDVAATSPYYYRDFSSSKMRIIVLNQFDSGCYYGAGCGGRLGQTQVTWFCNTLLSTPEGYGVVICMHSPEGKVDTPESMSAWNQTVNRDGRDEDTYGYAVNGLYVNSMRPIMTIVDAFISKIAISTTYNENTVNGNNGETVTISADFSQVADGVEFICYLSGHRHKDNVGYLHLATNKQLCINVLCSNCHYPRSSGLSFAEGSDVPRGDKGVTQDAFNVYAIDRQNGRVKIARIGSSVNFEGIERKFLLAPYKD